MPRLVHLAPVGRRKAIERSGIRADAAAVLGAGNVSSKVARAVFAMPLVPDFSVTYQWVRELRRFHGERMIAVHFVVRSEEPVLVGRYNRPHETMTLGAAVRSVLASPMGNEIILTRAVRAKEIVGVREITQLVGWTEVPEPGGAFDCLCVACVARGTPDLLRRLRAAYERHILAARRAGTPGEVRRALGNLEMPLERARGRIAPDKLLVFARSKDADVRRAATALLGYFSWADVERELARRLSDDHGGVREAAVGALVSAGGVRRAWGHVAEVRDDLVTASLTEHLELARDVKSAAAVMAEVTRGASASVRRALAAAATRLLRDDDLAPAVRATLASVIDAGARG
jgi:hypothetical protein